MKTNKLIIFVGLLFLGTMFSLSSTCSAQPAANVDYSKAFLVDVRTPQEFREGSAKGAINIPLNEVQRHLEAFKGKELIVVFCRSGARSGQAKSILEKNGIANVVNGGTWLDVDRALQVKKAKK
jgi:rhodanese-related sulfurtransferase